MSEQELKLNVPVRAQARVERAVMRTRFSQIQLRALYFDTPSRALVRARIALRLRLEGDQWVQTLKMPGEHSLSRVEINQDRPEATLDLSIYAGSPAGDILSSLTEPLRVCYETDVHRLLRDIRTRSGVVELAFDRGWLRAGMLQLPISEVEFELKRGKLEAVFEIGKTWQQRFGLILDFRSKAERGDRLAQLAQALGSHDALVALDANAALKSGDATTIQQQSDARAQQVADFWKPRGAELVSLVTAVKQRDPARALALVTTECLEQIVRNTAFLCEVDTAGICQIGKPEHIHQLRVGMRRLRSAWAFFDGLTVLPSIEHREQIKQYFSQLGGTRDEDVLMGSLLPALSSAGLPPLILPTSPHQESGVQLVNSAHYQRWLLDTLALCTIPDLLPAAPNLTSVTKQPPLKPRLIKKLKKWHVQVLRNGLEFCSLEIEQQHRLRKKCKRLRYALQFCEHVFPAKNLQRYRQHLSAVQDILGEMNDLYVAQPLFETLKVEQPQAWFACGWIQARLKTLTYEAAQGFKRLSNTPAPWD